MITSEELAKPPVKVKRKTKAERLKEVKAKHGLNTTASTVEQKWLHQKFIFMAPSKWGKTVFWAQGESNFFFRFEQRHAHVKNIGEDCRCWEDFEKHLGVLETIALEPDFPFEVVILDPVDRLIQIIDAEVIDWAKEKYKSFDGYSIGDIPEGNGWARRTTLINSTLAKLEALPCAKALLFHTYSEERRSRGNDKLKKTTIDVGGKAGSKLLGWSDHILHGQVLSVGKADVRRLYTVGSDTMEAGTSNPKLPRPFIAQLDDIGDYESIKKNYETFRGYFDHDTETDGTL